MGAEDPRHQERAPTPDHARAGDQGGDRGDSNLRQHQTQFSTGHEKETMATLDMEDVGLGPSPVNEAADKDEVEPESGAEENSDEARGWRTDAPPTLDLSDVASSRQRPVPSQRRPSMFIVSPTIVPRAQRRGLFGRFTLIPEIENPVEYKRSTKWLLTAIVAMAAVAAPLGAGIFYPVLSSLALDLHVTPTVANLSVAMYMLSMSIFPLWWSSFSETLGRRTIYLVSFSLFVIFSILCAVSVNITMLIVMRILGGGAAASVQAVGAGTIADLWEPRERGRSMGIFYLGPLMGPLLAPVIGGSLAAGFGWRSAMWFLAIYGGITLLLLFFALPETLGRTRSLAAPQPAADSHLRRTSTAQSVTHSVMTHSKWAAQVAKRLLVDPLSVLLYLRYPPVLVTVYTAAIAFGSLFVLNISIQTTFTAAPYHYSTIIIGLLYLPMSLGYLLASILGGRWIDRIMAREARKVGRYDADGRLVFLPEDRMRENIWIAGSLYPAALIWFGWTAQNREHWLVLSAANFLFGVGTMLVFGAATTTLTEFMPRRSSSGVAVNNFIRNIFSCVGTIVTQPLINIMGVGWLCTMIGLFVWVTGNAAIWLMRTKAREWRVDMDRKLNAGGR